MRKIFSHSTLCAALLILTASRVVAQSADTILISGRVVTGDSQSSIREALAVAGDRILAVGSTSQIRKLSGPTTRVIDLGGRTVIPGLIDSHMHAIRAALSFDTEVNWIGARSLQDALARIHDAARVKRPGSWLIVAGGWSADQFTERRRPTQAELQAAAPENPVYVQLGYGWALMTPLALKALKIESDADLPPPGKLERDASGHLTGAVTGGNDAIIALFDRLPKPTFDEQVEGTRKFFRELNRLGVTGVVDPGGNNLGPEDYQALFQIWRDREMTVRVAYALCASNAGAELEEFKGLTKLLPMGFGDDMLRFNGLGERVTVAMNNNDNPRDDQKEAYYQIVRWAAQHGLSVTMHWPRNASVDHLLGIFERVNREVSISRLRWSIAHLNDASTETLQRMKALGIGWTVQDAMYFGGDQFLQREGREVARRVPPVGSARQIGVAVGAGTDAHRVASYNPFTALQWFLDGKTVTGVALRGPDETPSRNEALRLYTSGSAWFSFDEQKRGSLEAGKLADLAVLSKDYLTVPVDQIGDIASLLTMVGGRVVYTDGPYQGIQQGKTRP
jgi:predicted amidohydrolase YtcJ